MSNARVSYQLRQRPIGHADLVTDQPTTPLPLPGQAHRPPAWADAATRKGVNRALWIALLLLLVAVVGAGGCVVMIWLGQLSQMWGLWALVATAGIAGGALAGGIAMVALWARMRGFLRRGPWVIGELTLSKGRAAELAFGRSLAQVNLDVRTGAFGDPGDVVKVEVRSDGDQIVLTIPPSRRVLRAHPLRDDD